QLEDVQLDRPRPRDPRQVVRDDLVVGLTRIPPALHVLAVQPVVHERQVILDERPEPDHDCRRSSSMIRYEAPVAGSVTAWPARNPARVNARIDPRFRTSGSALHCVTPGRANTTSRTNVRITSTPSPRPVSDSSAMNRSTAATPSPSPVSAAYSGW